MKLWPHFKLTTSSSVGAKSRWKDNSTLLIFHIDYAPVITHFNVICLDVACWVCMQYCARNGAPDIVHGVGSQFWGIASCRVMLFSVQSGTKVAKHCWSRSYSRAAVATEDVCVTFAILIIPFREILNKTGWGQEPFLVNAELAIV